jgi:hypothetical protein
MRSFAAATTMILLAACATTSASDEGVRGAPRAKDFVPLAVGNAWTYRVTPSAPDGPPLKVEVLSIDDKGFYVDSQGERRAPRTDGVYDGARFLIAEPVEPGRAWMAVPRQGVVERYTILSLGEPCAAPAGNWSGCLVVEGTEEQTAPDGRPATVIATWTYAPGVGMVRMTQVVKRPNGDLQKTTEMVLVDYVVATP